MNEEEKQAIKDTKDILKELNKNKDKDFIGRLYYKNKPIEDILQILLNLIDRQQKEIEELKQEKEYLNCIIESDEDNYINKDKIKEKIEEYKELSNNVTMQPQIYSYIVDVLQSLLEKGVDI